jgi:hypothetical protein
VCVCVCVCVCICVVDDPSYTGAEVPSAGVREGEHTCIQWLASFAL